MKSTNVSLLWGLLFGLIISWGAVGLAIFLQFYAQLHPCPLCIFSRLLLIILGGFYAVWFFQRLILKNAKNIVDRILFGLTTISILGGLALSGYHAWLMHLPPEQLPSCGPDLSYLLETLPLHEVVVEAFKGSGSCAQDKWHFLGLNFAQLGLGVYVLLSALQTYLFLSFKKMK